MAVNISFRYVTFTPSETGVRVVVITDIPSHIYCRLTLNPPHIHKKAVLIRGLRSFDDVRFCFDVYEDNEQYEIGDTLIHTFWKTNWPFCTTKWCYFWGYHLGVLSVSTSAIFQYHNDAISEVQAPLSELVVLADYATRSLISYHAVWPTCWGGVNLALPRQRYIPTLTHRVQINGISYYGLSRVFFFFHLPQMPYGYQLVNAKLSIIPTAINGIGERVCLTDGHQNEPVELSDFGNQNIYTTKYTSDTLASLSLGIYNDLLFNSSGKAWLSSKMLNGQQNESYDSEQNLVHDIYAAHWIAQTFTPVRNHPLDSFKLWMLKAHGTAPEVIVRVYDTDVNGKPAGPWLSQGSILASDFSTTPGAKWRLVHLLNELPLIAGTKYAVVCLSPAGTAANCAGWYSSSSGGYLVGQAWWSLDGGITWNYTNINEDLFFIEYNQQPFTWARLCLRMNSDVDNIPPAGMTNNYIDFKAPQAGDSFAPKLTLQIHQLP